MLQLFSDIELATNKTEQHIQEFICMKSVSKAFGSMESNVFAQVNSCYSHVDSECVRNSMICQDM